MSKNIAPYEPCPDALIDVQRAIARTEGPLERLRVAELTLHGIAVQEADGCAASEIRDVISVLLTVREELDATLTRAENALRSRKVLKALNIRPGAALDALIAECNAELAEAGKVLAARQGVSRG